MSPPTHPPHPTPPKQDVIDGYLLPLQAPDWDRGALLNLRAFSLPPAYDYSAVTAPVVLVVGSEDGPLTEAARSLSGLLAARPAGATRFTELQVWARCGLLGRCWGQHAGAGIPSRSHPPGAHTLHPPHPTSTLTSAGRGTRGGG